MESAKAPPAATNDRPSVSGDLARTAATGPDLAGKVEQAGLWEALAEARREITPVNGRQREMPENQDALHFSYHPAQAITTRYTARGARFGSGKGGDWQAEFHYAGAADGSMLSTAGTRAEYAHPDGVTEWFENRPEGIEHGFTLAKRPAGTGTDLRLEVSLTGVSAVATEDPATLDLHTPDGRAVLRYAGLRAWDAEGKDLPAAMSATPTGILLAVNDQGARYPLTVDPLVTSLEQVLEPEVTGTGSAGDRFGSAVAIDGTTAIIGVPNESTARAPESGSAYVFVRGAEGWERQAILMAEDGEFRGRFGASVAIEGDTAVVGTPGHRRTGVGIMDGGAVVFTRNGGVWGEQTRLASTSAAGQSVAISGPTILVGAESHNGNRGNVQVHERVNGQWTSATPLSVPDGVNGDLFGHAVAIDGDRLVVGAYKRATSRGSAYVFLRGPAGWIQEETLQASDGKAGDEFGISVGIEGSAILVGAPHGSGTSIDTGCVYPFIRTDQGWLTQSKLFASGSGGTRSLFGAAVDIDGDRAVIGSPGFDVIRTLDAGRAHIFYREVVTWNQLSSIAPVSAEEGANFGESVAIAGSLAIVGSSNRDTPGGEAAGTSTVFMAKFGQWSIDATLDAGEAAEGDQFGHAVAIEGDTAVVGAAFDYTAGGFKCGSAYVFTRSGSIWGLQEKLTAVDGAPYDYFGSSVAVSGNTVLIGAYGDQVGTRVDPIMRTAGSAYVFTRDGTSWSPEAKLMPGIVGIYDAFGLSLALDGSTAVIGAPYRDNRQGAAYIFTRGDSGWLESAILIAESGADYDLFGAAVAIEGGTILIGAPKASTEANQGLVYEFTRQNGAWLPGAILSSAADDGFFADDDFGTAVALSGNTALIGAPGDFQGTTAPPEGRGSCHFFVRGGGGWARQAKVTSLGPTVHLFGQAVAISGDHAVVGAEQWQANDLKSDGAAYFYSRENGEWRRQDRVDGEPYSGFGSSVAISGDTVMVGSHAADAENPFSGALTRDSGEVRIFRLIGSEAYFVRAFDLDGDGAISRTEWLRIPFRLRRLDAVFGKVDGDGDGGIAPGELAAARDVRSTWLAIGGMLARTDVFLEIDTDRDGMVTLTEIRRMWKPGTKARTIEGYWSRIGGGNGIDLRTWLGTKALPSLGGYEAAREIRAERLAVAYEIDRDNDGLVEFAEFLALLPANAPARRVNAAWNAATGGPGNEGYRDSITIGEFIEAPKLPRLPRF